MSRNITVVIILLCFALPVVSQTNQAGESNDHKPQQKKDGPRRTRFVIPRKAVTDYSSVKQDFAPSLMIREMPKQGATRMEKYPDKTTGDNSRSSGKNSILLPLIKGDNFLANPFSVSTPNDNDVAISDSGMLISVINTNIFVRNTKTNVNAPIKSLAAFTQPVNGLHQEFDPKVLYDPGADRFVLACMVGFVDSTSRIVVGFSQTNNPAGSWNLYVLPGDPLANNLWSDYPMISVSDKELFLTVNLLYNDSSWQTGFVETVVWQMSKDSGFAGNTMLSDLHSGISYNGKPLRNLCPVKGGSGSYGSHMFFLSNRNLASQNDTVFLVKLTDTIGAATGTINIKPLISNVPYMFPPDGLQNGTTEVLATNDSRNLGAFIENDIIQYVHNTKHPVNGRPTIHYGTIMSPDSASPVVSGYVIDNDSLDYAYPNISYAGLDSSDNSAIITFNHTSPKVYAGCSAILSDGAGSFSPVLKIKDGLNYVSLLQGSLERWGDYSGSQRRYNKPGEVWMSGFIGYPYNATFPKAHAAWVAKLTVDQGISVSAPAASGPARQMSVFPNPADELFTIDITLAAPEYLTFEIVDMSGRTTILLRDWVKSESNIFSFNGRDLAPGNYILTVRGNNGTRLSKKIVVN